MSCLLVVLLLQGCGAGCLRRCVLWCQPGVPRQPLEPISEWPQRV